MIEKNVKLYLGDGFPVRIPVSQYDTMWQFVFTIIHNSQPWQIPTGATAVLNGKKPDGNVFAFAGTIENNTVTVDADVQMTACAGDTICELSILDDGKTVGTANFTLAVESAPNSTGETPSASDVDAYGAIVSGELDTYFEQHPEMIEGKGLSEPIRLAILNCFRHVAWVNEHGSDYYNALYDLLMNKEVMSISAVFTQGSAVIYDTDTLDTLKQYLTVTVNYDDGTSSVVTTYTLAGELTVGTSTITVSYGGKSTTFDVTVTADPAIYLDQGTFTFSDGSKITIGPNNHVIIYNGSASSKMINASSLSNNTSTVTNVANVNNQTTEFLTLHSGNVLTVTAKNATTDATSWSGGSDRQPNVAINIRKKSAATNVLSNSSQLFPKENTQHAVQTEDTVIENITEDVIGSCVLVFVGNSYPVGSTVEFDLEISVE